MKRTIAIVAGGDTSEFHVSLRSAQGNYDFRGIPSCYDSDVAFHSNSLLLI